MSRVPEKKGLVVTALTVLVLASVVMCLNFWRIGAKTRQVANANATSGRRPADVSTQTNSAVQTVSPKTSTGPQPVFTCGFPQTVHGRPSEKIDSLNLRDGWKAAKSEYACLMLRCPADWGFVFALNYSLDGQEMSVALEAETANEIPKPLVFITPITDEGRMQNILGMTVEKIRKTKNNIGSASTEVYDFGVQPNDAYAAGTKHQFYLVYVPGLSRSYVVEARYDAATDAGVNLVSTTRQIVKSMLTY